MDEDKLVDNVVSNCEAGFQWSHDIQDYKCLGILHLHICSNTFIFNYSNEIKMYYR